MLPRNSSRCYYWPRHWRAANTLLLLFLTLMVSLGLVRRLMLLPPVGNWNNRIKMELATTTITTTTNSTAAASSTKFKSSSNNNNRTPTTSSSTQQRHSSSSSLPFSEQQQQQQPQPRCAILLYGLPRAFRTLVLPSLIEHVIRPNAATASSSSSSSCICDYYVYYHSITTESAGRSGSGGSIQADEQVLRDLLQPALQQYSPDSQLVLAHFTDNDFERERGDLLQKIHTTRAATKFVVADTDSGNDNRNYSNADLLYVPVKSDFGLRHYPTSTDNIVKMWHAQQGAWDLMEGKQHQQQQQNATTTTTSTYSHVAMLRLDVVYLTPIRIFPHGEDCESSNSNAVTIPAFAAAPVNDRMIYGPYNAVHVWAAERFQLLDQHIQTILKKDPGYGIHDEKYLFYTILPEIQRRGYAIQYDKSICFLRARADESIWATDCGVVSWNRYLLETTILGYRCRATWLPGQGRVVSLQCSEAERNLPDDWSTNRPSAIKRFHHYVSQLKRRFGLAQ